MRLKNSNLGMVDSSVADMLGRDTKASQLQPSEAMVPLVDHPGEDTTPTKPLQLPFYDKPQPTLLGIPKEIRLRILKLALPHTNKLLVCTEDNPDYAHRGEYFVNYSDLETQDGFPPGSPLPSWMHCSRQLSDESFEVMEGFNLYIMDLKPPHFERYPRVLRKNAKTIECFPWTIWADYASLPATFPKLREIDFTQIFPELPSHMIQDYAALFISAERGANGVLLETPIPNPDENDFTRRILPRFCSTGGRLLCDRFHDAVYKNDIKITFGCWAGPFKPSQAGSPHELSEVRMIMVGSTEI